MPRTRTVPADLHGEGGRLKRAYGHRPDEDHSPQQDEDRSPKVDARLADGRAQFLSEERPEEQEAVAAGPAGGDEQDKPDRYKRDRPDATERHAENNEYGPDWGQSMDRTLGVEANISGHEPIMASLHDRGEQERFLVTPMSPIPARTDWTDWRASAVRGPPARTARWPCIPCAR